jgi:predicted dehydrogenase
LRVIVVGMGVQGEKRKRVAAGDVVATVDPVAGRADYRAVAEVPVESYDAALVCVPDAEKLELLEYLIANGKHVLVEKPLRGEEAALSRLAAAAQRAGVACYTAYNHRFEPHFVRLRDALARGEIGRVYLARFFYGNGTAREVRNSPWRDKGDGVLPDLGSHLLDTALFLFDCRDAAFDMWAANRFENGSYDHVMFASHAAPMMEFEASLLSWRNHFTADVYGETGSLHISSLCKWGPSVFTKRNRVLPSGRPDEDSVTLVQADPTWKLEYDHFVGLCAEGGVNNIANDIWIAKTLDHLSRGARRHAAGRAAE